MIKAALKCAKRSSPNTLSRHVYLSTDLACVLINDWVCVLKETTHAKNATEYKPLSKVLWLMSFLNLCKKIVFALVITRQSHHPMQTNFWDASSTSDMTIACHVWSFSLCGLQTLCFYLPWLACKTSACVLLRTFFLLLYMYLQMHLYSQYPQLLCDCGWLHWRILL